MKLLLFILSLLLQTICFSQNIKTKVQNIDKIIDESEVDYSDIPVRSSKNFLLVKTCIEANKDTIYFYQDTVKFKLVKITIGVFNPHHLRDLKEDYWTYYFLKENLIMATNGHIRDFGRVYSFTNYYFENRKCIYRFGAKYNLQTDKWILKHSYSYLGRMKGLACM